MAESRTVSGRLLLLANLAAANVAAAVCVLTFLSPSFVGPAQPVAATEHRLVQVVLDTGVAWLVFLLAIVLLIANFAWLVRRPEAKVERNYVISETAGGPVRVAREALESGLRQAGEALPEITRLRTQVDASVPKRIAVVAWFQCAEGTSNLAASQRLRQALGDRFREMVRPVDGARVDFEIEFQGFSGKLGKKGADVPPPAEPEPPPFTGPKYPIDDDEHGSS